MPIKDLPMNSTNPASPWLALPLPAPREAGIEPPAPLATLDLAGAAALLGAHPETIRLKARAGQLPGRKVGKRWIFSTLALQRYLAGEWLPRETPVAPVNVTVTSEPLAPCRSTNERPARTGNTSSTPQAAERRYREALAPATRSRRRNSTTG
ncbi:helix-turn-helix domain-containing protein [Burkholderia gladioli]|nr:helix-turn-helix domain-containing protein [Burkholderia gladioli]